jgi:hypothetical protein
MRKLLIVFFLVTSFSSVAQENSVKETLSRIVIEIPDTFFSPLIKSKSDSALVDQSGRRSLLDTLPVTTDWLPPLYFTVFDTVNCYLRLVVKSGEPEGMFAEIAYWKRDDGTRLVMMTVNFSDMCVYEQWHRYFWIDDGKKLVPVNESELFPAFTNNDFISAKFLKRHKAARNVEMPYMLIHGENDNSLHYIPAFDYLFSCDEYFKEDAWYGLTEVDIIKKEISLSWNKSRFVL